MIAFCIDTALMLVRDIEDRRAREHAGGRDSWPLPMTEADLLADSDFVPLEAAS